MTDIPTITLLATSAVTALSPLLEKALDKGVEEFGKSTAGMLVDKLKQQLKHPSAKEAVDDLVKVPNDIAAQGALNMQLRKALTGNLELEKFLKRWITDLNAESGVTQTASTHGDNNKTTQIAGSGNSIN